jgi:membrane fusion protein, multidrug efflux system
MAVVEHTLGTVVANATVQVTARVQGTLESANFKEGQFVKKGDLLFQIDPRAFQAALAQARATLLRDEALLKNANRDAQRYNALYAQNAISSQQRDTSATNAAALAATVAADKAAVDMAQLNLGYTQIRSPIDGKTGPLLVQPGNMVAATGTTALVTIAQIQPVKLSFDLPQADLPLIQARQKVRPLIATIDVRDSKNLPLSAPVDFTSNVVSNQSGTVELRANFGNANLSLLPGQLVNVTVEMNNIPNALVVPHDAVNDGPNGTYVYVVVGGRALPRSVKILFDDSQNVAIQGDLKRGDQVIVEGQLRVVPDGPVQVFAPGDARTKSENGAGTMLKGADPKASGLL